MAVLFFLLARTAKNTLKFNKKNRPSNIKDKDMQDQYKYKSNVAPIFSLQMLINSKNTKPIIPSLTKFTPPI